MKQDLPCEKCDKVIGSIELKEGEELPDDFRSGLICEDCVRVLESQGIDPGKPNFLSALWKKITFQDSADS